MPRLLPPALMSVTPPRLVALALVALLAVGASACGSGATADPTVVFWAMGSEAEAADALVDGFRVQHPDIAVRVQRVPWSAAHEKLLTAYVGASMPDVFQLGNTWAAELATLGALEPLDQRLPASQVVDRGDFFAGALDANVVDGRLVALPWYVDTRILFYRRDLLERVGVVEAPRTWDEWRTAMARFRGDRARDPAQKRFGVFLPIDEWQTPVVFALQQGASLLREDDGRGNFQSAEVRRAFEFYTGLFADGLAPARTDAEVSNLYREFAAGYFAYFVTGPWNLAELDRRMPVELADAWATAPMPSPQPDGAAAGVSIAGGASLAISSASPRKDAAWKLVEYLLSVPVQKEFRRRSGDLPSRRSAWDDAGNRGQAPISAKSVPVPDFSDRARAFRLQLEHLAPAPKIPEWERIATKISFHLERVVRGETGLDAALADLDRDVDAILSKRRELRGSAAAESST